MKLIDCPVGANLRVTGIYTDDNLRSRLWELGVYENSRLRLMKIFVGKTIIVESDGAIIALGKGAAENIEVENV